MKALILCTALFAVSAQAQVIATAPNTKGGLINLTAAKGKCTGDSRVVYTTTTTGEYSVGCWSALDDRVFVEYASGESRLYDMAGFTMKSAKPAKQAGASL